MSEHVAVPDARRAARAAKRWRLSISAEEVSDADFVCLCLCIYSCAATADADAHDGARAADADARAQSARAAGGRDRGAHAAVAGALRAGLSRRSPQDERLRVQPPGRRGLGGRDPAESVRLWTRDTGRHRVRHSQAQAGQQVREIELKQSNRYRL